MIRAAADHDVTSGASAADVSSAHWTALAARRVFFGHQSVGADIIAGMSAIGSARPEIALRIVEAAVSEIPASPGIYHARIGSNRDPASKAAAFAAAVEAARPDIALFKYCYVDVGTDTDAESLFEAYRRTMSALRTRVPATLFCHVTVPLTTQETWKGVLRARLGRRATQGDANMVRARYNRLLLDAFAGKEPVFDLARLESTRPDGSRVFFRRNGAHVYGLDPAYTPDGGHLNDAGRQRVAAEFLAFLAGVARSHA